VAYSLVHVDDLPHEGPGGAVRFVRRHLGVGAFGINWFEIPPDVEGREHNEEETEQEEVNVIVAGYGVYRVEGEDISGSTRQRAALRSGDDARPDSRA
jgi:uncharacterized cupin superfamily protein